MINTIIFSIDKATNLKLLLESLNTNGSNMFNNITILYNYTSEIEEIEYNSLIKILTPNIEWIKIINFKKQLLEILKKKLDFTCFFMNNNLLYKKIENLESILDLFNQYSNLFCFSLRLGKNITYCSSMETNNVLRDEQYIDDEFMLWDWSKHYLDFGFPLSLNGHIFRTKEIVKLTNVTSFNNPESLEESWQNFDNFPKEMMASYIQSALINDSNIIEYNKQHNPDEQPIEFKNLKFDNINSFNYNFNPISIQNGTIN